MYRREKLRQVSHSRKKDSNGLVDSSCSTSSIVFFSEEAEVEKFSEWRALIIQGSSGNETAKFLDWTRLDNCCCRSWCPHSEYTRYKIIFY